MRFQRGWNRFWFEPQSPSPICIFRILFGFVALLDGLLWTPDFLVWFGAHGAAPLKMLQALGGGPVADFFVWLQPSDGMWVGGLTLYILAAVFVMIGFQTRPALVVIWLFLLALLNRNPAMSHQGDWVLRVCVIPLMLAPCSVMYSVDNWLRSRRSDAAIPGPLYAPWAQRLIQFQLWALYCEAFWGKITVADWRNGSAVYYVMHSPDMMRTLLPPWLDHVWICHLLTYYTLIVELSLSTLLWYKPARYWVMLSGTVLHLGILVFLNLDVLQLDVLGAYVCFIEPADLERFLGRVAAAVSRGRRSGHS